MVSLVSYEWTKDWYGNFHAIDPEVDEHDGSAFTLCGKIITHPGTRMPKPSTVVCLLCAQS
jgi:hypothetical protein